MRIRTGFVVAASIVLAAVDAAAPAGFKDPTAWGEDHVGKPMPLYEDGNTCLFCHRRTIGVTWQTNDHATTLRPLVDDPNAAALQEKAGDAQFVLGHESLLRLLKSTGAYGKLALSGSAWSPRDKSWRGEHAWNDSAFGDKCAGCHASVVDSAARTFQTPSLDCHTCHGVAAPEHTEDGALMLFSRGGRMNAEVEISICGSCHLRGGTARSTKLPYPNNFVPGDNLFKDFEVDWSETRIRGEDPGDAHVLWNARDVALTGDVSLRCTSCHDVHANSSAKHAKLPEAALCFVCHTRGESMKTVPEYERHNETCEY